MIYQILLISSVITLLLTVQSTTGHQNKDEAMLVSIHFIFLLHIKWLLYSYCIPNQKIRELTFRLDAILEKNMENDVKIAFLETKNAKRKIRMDHLEAENAENKIRIGRLEGKVAHLEENSSKKSAKMGLLEATNAEQDKDISKLKTKVVLKPVALISPGFSTKEMPSSCSELGHSLKGIYLVKNPGTKKIETVFCTFGTTRNFVIYGLN